MGSEHVFTPSEIHSIHKIIYHFIRSISRPQFCVGPVPATTFNWPHNLKADSEKIWAIHLMEMNVIVITWSVEIVPTGTANLKPNLAPPLFVSLLFHFPLESPRPFHRGASSMDDVSSLSVFCFLFFLFSCMILNFSANSFYTFSFIGLYRTNGPSWWCWTNRSRR